MNVEATDTQCQELAKLLHENTAILAALGDETNQHILIQMILETDCSGLRIGEIAALSNLSRAAATRHVQELAKAGLLRMRKEGTKHYYLFNRDSPALHQLRDLLNLSIQVLDHLPASTQPLTNSSSKDEMEAKWNDSGQDQAAILSKPCKSSSEP